MQKRTGRAKMDSKLLESFERLVQKSAPIAAKSKGFETLNALTTAPNIVIRAKKALERGLGFPAEEPQHASSASERESEPQNTLSDGTTQDSSLHGGKNISKGAAMNGAVMFQQRYPMRRGSSLGRLPAKIISVNIAPPAPIEPIPVFVDSSSHDVVEEGKEGKEGKEGRDLKRLQKFEYAKDEDNKKLTQHTFGSESNDRLEGRQMSSTTRKSKRVESKTVSDSQEMKISDADVESKKSAPPTPLDKKPKGRTTKSALPSLLEESEIVEEISTPAFLSRIRPRRQALTQELTDYPSEVESTPLPNARSRSSARLIRTVQKLSRTLEDEEGEVNHFSQSADAIVNAPAVDLESFEEEVEKEKKLLALLASPAPESQQMDVNTGVEKNMMSRSKQSDSSMEAQSLESQEFKHEKNGKWQKTDSSQSISTQSTPPSSPPQKRGRGRPKGSTKSAKATNAQTLDLSSSGSIHNHEIDQNTPSSSKVAIAAAAAATAAAVAAAQLLSSSNIHSSLSSPQTVQSSSDTVKRGRGRPRKNSANENQKGISVNSTLLEKPPMQEAVESVSRDSNELQSLPAELPKDHKDQPKRGRGRPRKNSSPVQESPDSIAKESSHLSLSKESEENESGESTEILPLQASEALHATEEIHHLTDEQKKDPITPTNQNKRGRGRPRKVPLSTIKEGSELSDDEGDELTIPKSAVKGMDTPDSGASLFSETPQTERSNASTMHVSRNADLFSASKDVIEHASPQDAFFEMGKQRNVQESPMTPLTETADQRRKRGRPPKLAGARSESQFITPQRRFQPGSSSTIKMNTPLRPFAETITMPSGATWTPAQMDLLTEAHAKTDASDPNFWRSVAIIMYQLSHGLVRFTGTQCAEAFFHRNFSSPQRPAVAKTSRTIKQVESKSDDEEDSEEDDAKIAHAVAAGEAVAPPVKRRRRGRPPKVLTPPANDAQNDAEDDSIDPITGRRLTKRVRMIQSLNAAIRHANIDEADDVFDHVTKKLGVDDSGKGSANSDAEEDTFKSDNEAVSSSESHLISPAKPIVVPPLPTTRQSSKTASLGFNPDALVKIDFGDLGSVPSFREKKRADGEARPIVQPSSPLLESTENLIRKKLGSGIDESESYDKNQVSERFVSIDPGRSGAYITALRKTSAQGREFKISTLLGKGVESKSPRLQAKKPKRAGTLAHEQMQSVYAQFTAGSQSTGNKPTSAESASDKSQANIDMILGNSNVRLRRGASTAAGQYVDRGDVAALIEKTSRLYARAEARKDEEGREEEDLPVYYFNDEDDATEEELREAEAIAASSKLPSSGNDRPAFTGEDDFDDIVQRMK